MGKLNLVGLWNTVTGSCEYGDEHMPSDYFLMLSFTCTIMAIECSFLRLCF